MKKAKQFLSVFVAVLMVLSIVPISGMANIDLGTALSASASDSCYNGFYYFILEDEVMITEYENESITGTLVIPETIEGCPVTAIDDYAFNDFENITGVSIPSTVTHIADNVFENCSALESVKLPAALETIGDNVFEDCTSLKSITFPASVVGIGDEVLAGCSALESITVDGNNTVYDSRNNCNAIIETASDTLISGCKNTVIPNGIRIIEDGAFAGCSELTDIVIPGSVETIGESAFDGCRALANVTLNEGLVTIGAEAFYECESLTSITFPDSLETIDIDAFTECKKLADVEFGSGLRTINSYAFGGCESLESIVIPKSVTCLEGGVFMDCAGLESITVEDGNTKYDSRNNCNAIIETSTNKLLSGCKNTVIPEGITTIESYAFHACKDLRSINIPASVTEIGTSAFTLCSGLEVITVAEGNTKYDSRNNCNAIIITADNSLMIGCRNSVIPDTVTSIEPLAFTECEGLDSVNIPDSVEFIGTDAFYKCSGLRTLTIGSGAESISFDAFMNCPDLTSITIDEDNKVYDSRDNCNAIIRTSTNSLIIGCKNTVIPDTVTTIAKYAFYECPDLTSIEIPDSVTTIEAYAFENTDLTSVVIPDSVESLGEKCFCYCDKLESVTIGDGVSSIGQYAFWWCDNLKNVYYHCTNTNFDSLKVPSNNPDVFADKSNWTKIHDYKEVTRTEATCTSPALVTYVCSDCNNILMSADETSLLPHTPATAVKENIVEATCIKEGSYDSVVYCSVCKAEISRETIKVDKAAHTVVTDAAVSPTCTKTGLTEGSHCSVCNTVIKAQETVAMTAHVDSDNNGSCDTCGASMGNSGESTTSCSHICHSSSRFLQFFWKIFNFFNKLFKANKTCTCGVAHY